MSRTVSSMLRQDCVRADCRRDMKATHPVLSGLTSAISKFARSVFPQANDVVIRAVRCQDSIQTKLLDADIRFNFNRFLCRFRRVLSR